MLKSIASMLVGAVLAAAVGVASATIGTAPVPSNGFGLVDGAWLNGLAGGQNYSFQSGITAAGTTQATATQLPAGIRMLSLDTVPASSGVALPPCIPGTAVSLYNNTTTTVIIYPSIANNPLNAAQDTINSGTTFSGNLATHVAFFAFCAKTGVWAAK